MFLTNWIILTLLSAITHGASLIITKKGIKEKLTPNQIVFLTTLTALFFVMLIFWDTIQYTSLFKFNLLITAFSMILYYYIQYNLLKNHEISLVSPMLNLSPFILLILSLFFLNEEVNFIQICGIALLVFSTFILESTMHLHHKPDHKSHHRHFFKIVFSKENKFFIGIFFMLLAISIAGIFMKLSFNEGIKVQSFLFLYAVVGFLISGFFILKNKEFNLFKILRKDPIIILGQILEFISFFLVNMAVALPGTLINLIVPLRRTSTLFSSFFGGILFHEKNLKKKLVATVIMLLGIILIVY